MSDCWNDKYDYLKDTRYLYHNDDYFKFLVNNVWEINKPVKIIDFGCGYGYLGIKLLPLIPKGSSYTGIDTAVDLLKKGNEIFSGSAFDFEFIESSVYSVPKPDDIYDLAVCHAVMMHLEEPGKAITEMKRIVKNGGMIITCESNWNAANAMSYIDGLNMIDSVDLGFLQMLYERSRKQTKRDGNIGLKMPALLHKAGLSNIQARTSDCVNVLLPPNEGQEKENLYQALGKDGFGVELTKEIIEKKTDYFIKYGFSLEEAGNQIEKEKRLSEYFIMNRENLQMTFSAGMTYSFGTVLK